MRPTFNNIDVAKVFGTPFLGMDTIIDNLAEKQQLMCQAYHNQLAVNVAVGLLRSYDGRKFSSLNI
jgi:hypothetical protein